MSEIKTPSKANRGKWTWKEGEGIVPYVEPEKKEVNAPYVITDEIPGGIRSMADRKTYTSKRRLRESYRSLGYVEVGNEEMREYQPSKAELEAEDAKRREEIEKAYHQVKNNEAPLSELDKERCKIINRQIDRNN